MNPKNILDEKFTMGDFFKKHLSSNPEKSKKTAKKGIFYKVSEFLYADKKKQKELRQKLQKTVDSVNKDFDSIKKFYKKEYGVDIDFEQFDLDDIIKT